MTLPEYQVQFKLYTWDWVTASRHRLLSAARKSLKAKRWKSRRQPAYKYRLVKIVELDV
jgi:hypothetical protein